MYERGFRIDAGEVVTGGPAPAHQPADPAAEGEPGQPGVTNDARRGGQAVALGGRVELAVQHPGPGPGQEDDETVPEITELNAPEERKRRAAE